jgi:1,4-dihydroxy-2-naphthoyl-CoA hydrolase
VSEKKKDIPVPDSFGGDLTGEFVSYIGLEFEEVTADRVVASWPAEPKLHQPYGIVHGGVHSSVVETQARVGAAMWFADRGKVVGVNNNTDFYKAVTTGTITSTATPLHRGSSQQVWVVESVSEDGTVVARGQVRLANLTEGAPPRRSIGNIR